MAFAMAALLDAPQPEPTTASRPVDPAEAQPDSAEGDNGTADDSCPTFGNVADVGPPAWYLQAQAWLSEETAPFAVVPAKPRPRALGTSPLLPGRGNRRIERSLGDSGRQGDASTARCRRLEQELSDLREAYARKIARTELQCESRMRQHEEDTKAWFRDQRKEIEKMKAGVIIMHTLFQRLLRRSNSEKAAERDRFNADRRTHEEVAEQLKADRAHAQAHAERRLQEQADDHSRKISEERGRRAAMQESMKKAESDLAAERADHNRLQEAHSRLRSECDHLNKKLEESEKNEELARKQARIEELEKDLRTLRSAGAGREAMKARAEAEALRQEIMEYVRFIVHLLPDDLRHHVDASQKTLPQEVKDKLAERAAAAAGRRVRSPGRAPASPTSYRVEALPPVAQPTSYAVASATYHGGRVRPSSGAPPLSSRGR